MSWIRACSPGDREDSDAAIQSVRGGIVREIEKCGAAHVGGVQVSSRLEGQQKGFELLPIGAPRKDIGGPLSHPHCESLGWQKKGASRARSAAVTDGRDEDPRAAAVYPPQYDKPVCSSPRDGARGSGWSD
jgi:hypothetical protein